MRSHGGWRGALAVAFAACASWTLVDQAAPDSPDDAVVQAMPTSVSGHGRVIAWSRFDAQRGEYRLAVTRGDDTDVLPISGRSVPFDVDAGPGRGGRVVLVYSRCRREPPDTTVRYLPAYRLGTGCRLYRYDLAASRERQLEIAPPRRNWSLFLPAVWRGHIVYAAASGGYARRSPNVRLYWASPRGTKRIRGGARGIPDGGEASPGPTSVDLRGRTLAYAWRHYTTDVEACGRFDPTAGPRRPSRIVLQQLGGARRSLASAGCEGEADAFVDQPQFAGRELSYVFLSQTGASGVRRVGIGQPPATLQWTAPAGEVVSHARSGGSAATAVYDRAETRILFEPLAFSPLRP